MSFAGNHKASRCRTGAQRRKVSVVLPVFNGERYLGAALESVLQQSWHDLELIVVDDGSTDHSGEIARDFARKDERVLLIRQENLHLAAALNRGFEQATGDYHTWVSADNVCRPDFLSTLVIGLEARPSTALVYSDYELIDADGIPFTGNEIDWPTGRLDKSRVCLPSAPSRLRSREENIIGAAFLYRALAWDILGPYRPCRKFMEDYDFWLRMFRYLAIDYVQSEEGLILYRIHPNSLTATADRVEVAKKHQVMLAMDRLEGRFPGKVDWYSLEHSSGPGKPETSDHLIHRFPQTLSNTSGTEAAFLLKVRYRLNYWIPFERWAVDAAWRIEVIVRSDSEGGNKEQYVVRMSPNRGNNERLLELWSYTLADALEGIEVAVRRRIWDKNIVQLNMALAQAGLRRRMLYWHQRIREIWM